jgi:hypothetical protein
MATKKSAPADASKARLAALKKIGLLPNVSARGKLDDAEKRKVRDAWKKYHTIAEAPKGEFKKQDVSDFFPGQIKAIQKAGVAVINGQAFIRTENYKSVKIVKEKYKSGSETKYILGVERKTDDRKKEFEVLGSPVEIAAWRERLVRDFEAGRMKDGQYVALKAFDNSPMARSNTVSLQTIFNYESKIQYHDDPDKVRAGLRLVVITVKDLKDFDANTKSAKQKGKDKYHKRKIQKKTQTKKLTGRVQRR